MHTVAHTEYSETTCSRVRRVRSSSSPSLAPPSPQPLLPPPVPLSPLPPPMSPGPLGPSASTTGTPEATRHVRVLTLAADCDWVLAALRREPPRLAEGGDRAVVSLVLWLHRAGSLQTAVVCVPACTGIRRPCCEEVRVTTNVQGWGGPRVVQP